ncbi:MAG: GDP-mannose 4,6-dehydratase [Rhodospirillaceae bacterium]|nr:GDP-mannose 4,6-dehydratase [Rhodospirillaceae bacterium]
MSKVLVLGSNSFSGTSFISYLLDQGIDVVGASRSEEPDPVFLPYRWEKKPGTFHFEKVDLNHDLDSLVSMINTERFSTIVNFAAQSMVGQSWDHPEDWMMTNVVSASKLAEKLRHIDFLDKYVHVTTPEVYGSTDGWIIEDQKFAPSTPYAVSRAAGDMTFDIYRESFGLPVVGTRAANVYGPGQRLYRIIPRTILSVLLGDKLQLHGGGVSTRSFIHMDDVSLATWAVAQNAPVGETYHISTPKIVSIRELVELICAMLDAPFEDCVDVAPDRVGKDDAYWLNSDKIRSTLGWTDQISLETGLEHCIGWAKDNLETLRKQPLSYFHRP